MTADLNTGWTAERVELLKAHFHENLSASENAAILGGVSKNAVIGKRHRVGLRLTLEQARDAQRRGPSDARPKPASHARTPRRTRVASNGRQTYDLPPNQPLPMAKPMDIPATAVPFIAASRFQCKFCIEPHDAPASPEMMVCGARTIPGEPWCSTHHSRVYTTTDKRVDLRDPDRNVIRRAA